MRSDEVKKGFEMYKKSYDNGECNFYECTSALNLGVLYYSGSGVNKNLALAHKYTKESAEKGNLDASKNLKYMCSENPELCK